MAKNSTLSAAHVLTQKNSPPRRANPKGQHAGVGAMRVEQRAPTDPLWSMVHAPLQSLAFKASSVPAGVGENGGERRVGSMGRLRAEQH